MTSCALPPTSPGVPGTCLGPLLWAVRGCSSLDPAHPTGLVGEASFRLRACPAAPPSCINRGRRAKTQEETECSA